MMASLSSDLILLAGVFIWPATLIYKFIFRPVRIKTDRSQGRDQDDFLHFRSWASFQYVHGAFHCWSHHLFLYSTDEVSKRTV